MIYIYSCSFMLREIREKVSCVIDQHQDCLSCLESDCLASGYCNIPDESGKRHIHTSTWHSEVCGQWVVEEVNELKSGIESSNRSYNDCIEIEQWNKSNREKRACHKIIELHYVA